MLLSRHGLSPTTEKVIPYVGDAPTLSAEFEAVEVSPNGIDEQLTDRDYGPLVWSLPGVPDCKQSVLLTIDSVEATKAHTENVYALGPGSQVETAVRSIMSGGGWNPCRIIGIQRVDGGVSLQVFTPNCPLVLEGDHGFTYSGEITTPPRVSASANTASTIHIGLKGGGVLRYTPGGFKDSKGMGLCSDEYTIGRNN